MHETRFAAYRDAVRSILERRLFNRLRETMIQLDETAGKLQGAVFRVTVVATALTGVGVFAGIVALVRSCA